MTEAAISSVMGQEWIFKNEWGFESVPTERDHETYGKALMVCVNGDGVIADAERRWILGYAGATSAPEDVVERLAEYRADEDIRTLVDSSPAIKASRRALVLDAIRACDADADLAPEEVEVIRQMAARLDLDLEFVDRCMQQHRDEKRVRDNRLQLVWPDPAERPY